MDGQFIPSFETTVSDLLGSEAQQLAHMTSFPEVATDMTVSEAVYHIPTQAGPWGKQQARPCFDLKWERRFLLDVLVGVPAYPLPFGR